MDRMTRMPRIPGRQGHRWRWRAIGFFLFAGVALVLVAGWTVSEGPMPTSPLAASTCNPQAFFDGVSAPSLLDGNTSTFVRTSGGVQEHAVRIDFGCLVQLRRFRRHMTCDGFQTSGPACHPLAMDGARHRPLGELVRYKVSDARNQPFVSATYQTTRGWEPFQIYPANPAVFGNLPYGWTPWLELAPPQGVLARIVEFHFVDANDAVNEIELDFTEGAPGPPGTANISLAVDATRFVSLGGQFNACFRVTNLGPEPATDVLLFGGFLIREFGMPSQGTCDSELEGCSFGTLAPGESATVSGSGDTALSHQFTVSTSFDAYAREPDLDNRNNVASAYVTGLDCEQATEVGQVCPILTLLAQKICELRLDLPCDIPPAGLTAGKASIGIAARLRDTIKAVAARVLDVDLDLFYRFRDEILSRSPEGRRYISLYETHGPEISGLLLTNSSLRASWISTLQLWQETLRALVEGRSAQAAISSQEISALQSVLEEIKRLGSPALSAAIQAEQARLGLPAFAGGSIAQALTRFEQPGCPDPDTTLCLQGGRFRATASWRDFQGNTGAGRAVALTPDTGSFWFFSPENVELVVKALDARSVNGNFWVFYGALSNVSYTLTVTDTATGEVKTYTNPSGTFGSAGDTAAFPGTGTIPPVLASPPPAASRCSEDGTQLCLSNRRFEVAVSWRDFEGRTGVGRAVDLTSDTGYLWFFSPENVEIIVKVLDARAVNGRFWVFYGALSNVEYTITVKDTWTGAVRTYSNPAGRFGSAGDTEAF